MFKPVVLLIVKLRFIRSSVAVSPGETTDDTSESEQEVGKHDYT